MSEQSASKVTVLWHLSGNASVYRTTVDTAYGMERGLTENETIRRCIAMRVEKYPEDIAVDEIFRSAY